MLKIPTTAPSVHFFISFVLELSFRFRAIISFKSFVCLACNLYLNLQQIKKYVFPLLHFTLRFFLVPIKKRHLRLLPMLPLPVQFHSIEVGCLHSGINSPANTRHSGKTTIQCKFDFGFSFFFNYNIIYEKLINISSI